MHNLFNLFDAFVISNHLGVAKPGRRMFMHALDNLGILARERGDVAMVGNNLARDVRGANSLGLVTIWLVWNQWYPCLRAADAEIPDCQASSALDLRGSLETLGSGGGTAQYAYP